MSRSHAQDDRQQQPEHRTPPPERESTSGWRGGVTREAARTEMDRFRGVAEYETRKLFGQHSALKQPVSSAPHEDSERPDKRKEQ